MEEFNNVQRLGDSRNKMYWIVYQTTNKVNNKIYIGVHKTNNPYKFDGYIGNGVYITQPNTYMYAKTKFESAVKKYGTENFNRVVLSIFENEEDAYNEEARLVDENFLKRPDVYNMILGGKIPPEVRPIKPVYQYNTDGTFLKEYNSFIEASKAVGRTQSSISDSCTSGLSCGGFYWSREKQDKIEITHDIKNTKVLYQYSVDGEFLQEFESTRATGYSQASQSAILGNLVDGKYYFCYVKAENYSKARDIYVKSRTIFQYDSNGEFIQEWKYLDALKEFPNDGINQAIRHKTLTKSGYYWGLQKYEIYNQPIKKQSRKIAKYDKDNNLIKIYNNSSECYAENGKGVYKNLVGIRKQYKGFIYKYIE